MKLRPEALNVVMRLKPRLRSFGLVFPLTCLRRLIVGFAAYLVSTILTAVFGGASIRRRGGGGVIPQMRSV